MAAHGRVPHGVTGSSVSHERASLLCLSCRMSVARFQPQPSLRSSNYLDAAAPQNHRSAHLAVGVSSMIPTSTRRTMLLVCRLQDVQSLHLGVKKRMCLTRASHTEAKDDQSSEKPGWQSNTVDAVKSFPWEKVYVRFVQRVLDLAWISTKWLVIPVFALSTLSELFYTLSAKKDIFIPLGILSGVLLAKVIGNASLDVVKELQDGRTTWPLIVMGLFFVLLKLLGPYYPSWGAVFLPHVANAGLVQTALLFRESQQVSL